MTIGNALSTGPSLFDYVSLIMKINMMGTPLELPIHATSDKKYVEDTMAYWREDLGVNLYHWQWHMVHPFSGPMQEVKKDRRGELFYYLHQQILARYNVERLCNNLDVAQAYVNWDEPIPEAYYPILNLFISSKNYPTRSAKMKLRNVRRRDLGLAIDINDLKRYRDRINEAIYKKRVISVDGTEIPIDNDWGIDILGNVVEASILSPNEDYYGSIHNNGHIAIAVIHDPENKYNQTTGVMFKPNTAMRDPLFYTWHSFLNSFFVAHKASLPAYNEKALSFPGVQVTSVDLIPYRNGKYRNKINTLYTYLMKSDVNMSRGLDFIPGAPVLVRMTHQNHEEFDYVIEYTNNFIEQVLGTVRIFLLPVIGHDKSPMKLEEQRSMAIEMDKFVHPLKPGTNKIIRSSTMSSATIPFEQSFRDLDIKSLNVDRTVDEQFYFCGCGWPQHLLVPRGTAEGYPMLLFAMITDANLDRVNPIKDIHRNTNGCKPSESVCGLFREPYPDKRPVGFPFDRPARNGVDTIDDFLTPNMASKPITIFHLEGVRAGRLLTNATSMVLDKMNYKSLEEDFMRNNKLA